MYKKITIQSSDPTEFSTIEEYLLHTYGEKKLKESVRNSNPTFLDVIGYTLDYEGFETIEGAYYEDEIEEPVNEIDENDQEYNCKQLNGGINN